MIYPIKPVARQALQSSKAHVASECPLAGDHIVQGMERLADGAAYPKESEHPIQLFAKAYGLI